MNRLHQLRGMLPVTLMFYLLVGLAHWHPVRMPQRAHFGFSAEETLAGLRWHMLQIARNEHYEAFPSIRATDCIVRT